MGRKRTKKSCTSCGFSHVPTTGKECEVPEGEIADFEEDLPVVGMGEETVGSRPGSVIVTSEAQQPESPLMTSDREPPLMTSTQVRSSTSKINDVERKLGRRMDGMESSLLDINTKLDMFLTKQASDKKPKASKEPAVAPEAKKKTSAKHSWGVSDESTSEDDDDHVRSSAAKKKKERERFKHKNYIQLGESVTNFESLMVVTFRTIIELQESDIDVSGLIQHCWRRQRPHIVTRYSPGTS